MSKEETKIIDFELTPEFLKEEAEKISAEELTRKALSGIKVLEQEKKINSETTLPQLLEIIKERKNELGGPLAYIQDVTKSKAVVGDEIGSEFHDIANQDLETAERLWVYLNSLDSAITALMVRGLSQKSKVGFIKFRLKKQLDEMENQDIVKEDKVMKKSEA